MHPPNPRLGKPDKLSQGAHSQTSYSKVQWEDTLDKRDCRSPTRREESKKEEGKRTLKDTGYIGSQTRNTLGYTHAARR